MLQLPGRPDRRMLAIVLLGCVAVCLLVAVLPRTLVAGMVGAVLPSSGGGSMREVLLARHSLVFGTAGVALLVVVWALPAGLDVLAAATARLRRPETWVFLACLIGLVVLTRVALSGRMLPIVPGEDTGHYFQLASTLLEEGRFIEYASHPNEPDGFRAWRLPGFPAALAGAMALFGRGQDAVLAVNTVWMIVLVVSIYFLVRRIGTEGEARVAAVLCAFYPALVQANMRALSELQYASLTALGVCLVFGYGLGGEKRWTFLGGAALGLAALTRGNGLLLWAGLTVVMPVYSAATRNTTENNERSWLRREDWLGLAAMTIGFLMTTTPWMVRNYLVLGEWVALATSGGANMWLGHHPGSSGLLRPETRPSFPNPSSELAMSEYGLRKSLEYWLAAPVENLKTGARIVVEILKVDNGAMGLIEHGNQELPRWLEVGLWVGFNVVYYSLWLAAAVWSVARMTGRWVSRSRPGILILVAIGYVLTYVPFIGWGRYKIPALPFLVAAASMIVVSMACPLESSGSADRVEPDPAGAGR